MKNNFEEVDKIDSDVHFSSKTKYGLPDKVVKQHPWKLSREKSVLNVLKKRNLHDVADIGVNDMFYTNKVKKFVDGNVYAVDIFFPEDGMMKKGVNCINDVKKLPENELDCVIMMDVLEHIEDDLSFFNIVVNKLKTGGTVLITVPAYQFLFSAHDIRSLHYRRYNRKQLLKLLQRDDLKIEKVHYFYTSLFLIRLLNVIVKKSDFKGNEDKWSYSEKHIITVTAETILNIDFFINKILDKIGIHLPGLSLLAVCKKV
ncbi:MAG: class I SAM-dependent methyltransferase [Rickettsiales bacterium]|jgi:SAM-dependent methyltransferase|nr:class I SAM-dependent methyltransferase [Rickettsiales bacterium]